MEGSAAWVHQQQACIGFDELTSMVSELMGHFEREQDHPAMVDDTLTSDWISPSGMTRVVRHGSSAALHNVLNQVPDAISAEFEVIHCRVKVFSWCEYLWPHLQRGNACQRRSTQISLPSVCLDELLYFHEQHETSWLRRYQLANSGNSLRWAGGRAKVDKVGVVAKSDRFKIL